jgi:hypothetical protein
VRTSERALSFDQSIDHAPHTARPSIDRDLDRLEMSKSFFIGRDSFKDEGRRDG